VKRVQNLNLADACAQAEGDAGGKPWVVAHRRNHAPWLITMRAELFFELVREFEPQENAKSAKNSTPHPYIPLPDRGGEGDGSRSARRPTKISGMSGASPDENPGKPNDSTEEIV
jgi:hypothetical protein